MAVRAVVGAGRHRRRGRKFDRLLGWHRRRGDPMASSWRQVPSAGDGVARHLDGFRRPLGSGLRAADLSPSGAGPGQASHRRRRVPTSGSPFRPRLRPGRGSGGQGISASNWCETHPMMMTTPSPAWAGALGAESRPAFLRERTCPPRRVRRGSQDQVGQVPRIGLRSRTVLRPAERVLIAKRLSVHRGKAVGAVCGHQVGLNIRGLLPPTPISPGENAVVAAVGRSDQEVAGQRPDRRGHSLGAPTPRPGGVRSALPARPRLKSGLSLTTDGPADEDHDHQRAHSMVTSGPPGSAPR